MNAKTIWMIEYMNMTYTSLKTQQEQAELLSHFAQKQTKDGVPYFVLIDEPDPSEV